MTGSGTTAAAVVGIGHTRYSRDSRTTEWELAIEAISAALQDAGIEPRDVDGLVRFTYDSVDEAAITRSYGMTLRWYSQTAYGGLGAPAVVGQAAAAVASGQARIVVGWRSLNGYSGTRYGRAERTLAPRPGPLVAQGDRAPSGAFVAPYGLLAPTQVMAMWATRYQYLYGLSDEDLTRSLGRVAVDQRAYAVNNPDAVMGAKPLTYEDYLEGRMIADPLRLFDFALETDGAVAIVVASPDVALTHDRTPVWIRGAIHGLPPFAETVNLYGDLRNSPAYQALADELYSRAGCSPADISMAMLYDATTISVLLAYEAYGFAPEGESWKVIGDAGIGLDSPLPVNTMGGHLSEAYVHGMNHVIEAVRQCRGTAINQVRDVEAVLCASGPTAVILSP
jgi:acetyl-CoA acetyltransferase